MSAPTREVRAAQLARIDEDIAEWKSRVDSLCREQSLDVLQRLRRQLEGELINNGMFRVGDIVRINQLGWEFEIGDIIDYGQTLGLIVPGRPGYMKLKASDAELAPPREK